MGNLCEQMYRYGRDTERAEMKAEYEAKLFEDQIASSLKLIRILMKDGDAVETAIEKAELDGDLRDEVIRRLESESAPRNETN